MNDQLTFTCLLLFLAEIFRVLDFRNRDDSKGHIMPDALNIVVDASYEMLVYGFPNE